MQPLVQALGEHLGVGRVTEAAVLAVDGVAEPGTQDHAAAGQAVQGGHLPGQLGRPPPGHGRDRGAQPDPAGGQGRGSEQDPGIGDFPAQVLLPDNVIPDEQRVPAGLLGPAGHLGEDLRRRDLPEVRNVDRVPHSGILPPGTDKTGGRQARHLAVRGRQPAAAGEGDGPLAQPQAASGWGHFKPTSRVSDSRLGHFRPGGFQRSSQHKIIRLLRRG